MTVSGYSYRNVKVHQCRKGVSTSTTVIRMTMTMNIPHLHLIGGHEAGHAGRVRHDLLSLSHGEWLRVTVHAWLLWCDCER